MAVKRSIFYPALALFCVATFGLAAERPLAVSPGSPTGSLTGDACPTFSWGSVPGARLYELVVYRVDDDGEASAPVVSETFSGSASSWTPSLDRCLTPGGEYAWSVRAIGRRVPSDWSPPSLFAVSAAPGGAELEEALEVMRQYMEERRAAAADGVELEQRPEREAFVSPAVSRSVSPPVGAAVGPTQLTVDGGVTATSFTGDGSTLTALDPANLSVDIHPRVERVPVPSSPPIPAGLTPSCLVPPGCTTLDNDTCPVVKWNGFTYWAFSYIDNRTAMNIVAYRDADGSVVSQTDKTGARYVCDIAVNQANSMVTFTGQASMTVTMTYTPTWLLMP